MNPYFAEQLPVKITAVTGENVTIVCNAEAYPSSLTYQWQKYNGASFVALSGQVNRNLELTSVTVEDLGQYRCVVQSEELDSPPIASNVATVFGTYIYSIQCTLTIKLRAWMMGLQYYSKYVFVAG